MPNRKRRELTDTERARAARVKRLWLEKKSRERVTQEEANAALGWSPSTFGQYINGVIPMNLEAALKIAAYLEVPVTDFYESETARQIAKQEKLLQQYSGALAVGVNDAAAPIDHLIERLDQNHALEVMKRLADRLEARHRARLLAHIAQTLAEPQ